MTQAGYTREELSALFLEQLKRTNPDPKVQVVIEDLEKVNKERKAARSRKPKKHKQHS